MKDSKNIIFNIPKNKFNEVLEDDFIKDINITLDEVKTVAESWELNEDFGEAISIILPDGTVYDLDSFDVHVYFANVFTQPEASIEDDKEDTTKDAYDVLDYLYYNLGIIGTNSGTSYYDDHCKVIICKKPTDIQYSKIREFLDASLDKRYVWIYCEEEYNRYDFEQVTVDEIIDKIKRYFAFGRLEENYTSGLKSYNSLDGTDKMWVPGHTFKTADGTKKYYRGTEFIVPRDETACKIYDNIIKAGFNCYVDGPRQSEYDIRNLPEKIDSAEIYADDGTDDIEFHVRLVGDKYLQFREVYIRDNKKGKGLIGKLIKAVLDAIDSSWQVEVHVNINNEFWSHIVNKYPNYKWMGVSILKEMAEFKKISPITYFIPTTLKRIWGREFPNYHIEEVNIEDIVKTNHLLDNNSVLERRPDIWGSSYKNYHFKPDIAAYDVHYPIRLDQKHRILDGNHRFIALFNDGYKTAEVLVKNKELKESIGDKVLTNSKTINEGSHLVDKDNKAVFYTDSAYTLKNYIINNVKDEFIRVIYYPDSSIYCFCDADMGIHSMLEEMVQEAGLVDDGAPAERYVIYSKELDHEDVIDYGNDVTIYEYPEFFFAVVQDYGMFTSSSLFEALGKPINKYGWEDYHLVEKIVKKGNKWQVQSEKGRNMGTYNTKKEAEKRLGQVEYFKHMNEDLNIPIDAGLSDNPKIVKDNSYNVNWYYFGDCISTVDDNYPDEDDEEYWDYYGPEGADEDAPYWDATEMAQALEKAIVYIGPKKLIDAPKEALAKNVICGVIEDRDIGFVYNIDNDIHYFFDIGSELSEQVHYFKHINEDLQETDNEGNILSKEQAEFFKNSIVRDEQGRLLVCYHGTPNGRFNQFEFGRYINEKEFAWFTPDESYANNYRFDVPDEDEPSYTFAVYLNVEKPFVININVNKPVFKDKDGKVFTQEVIDIANDLGVKPQELADFAIKEFADTQYLTQNNYDYICIFEFTRTAGFRKLLEKRGYDGIFQYEGVGHNSFTIGVMYPEQIKEITNKNPTNSNNIDESLKEDVEIKGDEFSFTLEDICKQYPDLISNSYKPCGNAFIMPDGKFILSGKKFDTHRDFAIQTIMDLENKTLDEIDDEWDTNYVLKSFTEYFNLIRVNDGSNEEMDDRAYFVILKNTMTPAQHNSLLNYLDNVLNAHRADNIQAFVGRNQVHGYWRLFNNKNITSEEILNDCKFAMIRGFFAESLKEELQETDNEDNVLDALDKEFGQEEVYMWSTYILPNGHFLNSDNAQDYWDEVDEEPIYEHCDFEDWAYQKGYNLSDIYNNCIKMNVTYPYLSMPDKAKPTQEQLNAIRKILDRKDLFEPEGKFYWYDIFPEEKVDSKGENLLAVYTPVGDELFDLDVSNADDIIRAINQAYVRGGFFTESLNESKGKDTFIFNGKKGWSGAVNTLDGTIEEVHSYKEAAEVGFHHSFYFSDNQLMKMEEGETCFFCVFPDHSIQINGMMRFNPEDAGITLDEKFLENRIREQITFTE